MANRRFKNLLREYFTFTRIERNGVIVLLFLIVVTLVVKAIYPVNKMVINEKQNNREIELVNSFAKIDSINNNPKEKYNSKFVPDRRSKTTTKKLRSIKVIEINSADSTEFEKLPGIGPVLSGRIVKFRNKLGGFYQKEQLLEVFGLKIENFKLFEKLIIIDTLVIKQLAINKATFKEINAHPYITFEQTKEIFRLRNKQLFIDLDVIKRENLFDPNELKKVLPYLNFIK